ncbi:hypothetical protein FGB62_8g47 [Gracilaria domingensis]|nr:hypothetical protein FGB62_8g47 [Gracilaria domingensis]
MQRSGVINRAVNEFTEEIEDEESRDRSIGSYEPQSNLPPSVTANTPSRSVAVSGFALRTHSWPQSISLCVGHCIAASDIEPDDRSRRRSSVLYDTQSLQQDVTNPNMGHNMYITPVMRMY